MPGLPIACLLIAYLGASGRESWVHSAILHASKNERQRWRKYGSIGALLRLAHFYHNTIHHRRTFKSSFFIQFDNPLQKRKLDSALIGELGIRLRANSYGTTVTGTWEIATFVAVPLAFITPMFLKWAPALLPVGVAIAVLPLLLSRYIHPLLHIDYESESGTHKNKSEFIRRTCAFRYLQAYHRRHHEDYSINFNLLLGADWIFRKRVHSGKRNPDTPADADRRI